MDDYLEFSRCPSYTDYNAIESYYDLVVSCQYCSPRSIVLSSLDHLRSVPSQGAMTDVHARRCHPARPYIHQSLRRCHQRYTLRALQNPVFWLLVLGTFYSSPASVSVPVHVHGSALQASSISIRSFSAASFTARICSAVWVVSVILFVSGLVVLGF